MSRTCYIVCQVLSILYLAFLCVAKIQLCSAEFIDRSGVGYKSRLSHPDYYERYDDSFSPWNEGHESINHIKTGIESPYGDSRCKRCGVNTNDFLGRVTVKTRLGSVEGTYVYLCDGPSVPEYNRPKDSDHDCKPHPYIYGNLTVFLGIPYAKPPTRRDGLRFKPPQFLPSFNVIQALKYKEACPQSPNYYGINRGVAATSEDCLYLNIFSPSVIHRREKYPVMIYIHGGEWDHGSANTFPAQMLASSQNLVVVTFNYRLGPLGFFATADNSSAGNYGLLDQVMAIEWVYDNIEYFNGDPKLITLFGAGTGAASAGIHILNYRLRDKVKRVIAQSGAAVASWASISDPTIIRNKSIEYAKMLNCYFSATWHTVDCLKDISLSTLQVTNLEPKLGWYPWAPVIDAYTRDRDQQVLPASPEDLLKESHFSYFDGYMSGITKDEAVSMLWDDYDLKSKKFRITKEYFLRTVKKFPDMYNYTLDKESLIKAISFFYLPCDENSENITLLRQNYIDMLSDSYYKAPSDKMIKLLLGKGIKTYLYVLNVSAESIKRHLDQEYSVFNKSIPHNAEYYFITGAPFMDSGLYPRYLKLQNIETWSEEDRNMSQFFMEAFANFARFGNPTPTPLFDDISWKRADLNDLHYLSINTTNHTTVMQSNYRQKESQFWNIYVHDVMQLILPTWPPTYQPWEIEKNTLELSLYGALSATGLFLILSVMCCYLYCRAKSKHVVSTEDIPDAISTTPSSIDTLLNVKKVETRNRYLDQRLEMEQKHTQV